MKLMGKEWVGFSLRGEPSRARQIIMNINSETNFCYARNKKKEKRKKLIRVFTDISVNCVLFDIYFQENSGKSYSRKVQILVSLKYPENGPFSGEILKIDRFSVKCLKISGGSFSDAGTRQTWTLQWRPYAKDCEANGLARHDSC
jgi:hypothetical protein